MTRRRCLFGITDDLHAYAERMHAVRRDLMGARPLLERNYGPVHSAVVHRQGCFQTELVTVLPSTRLPSHRHPGVDSIECPMAGFIRFLIDGEDPYEGVPDERLARFAIGKLVRIQATAYHSGMTGPNGVCFLSMQRWGQDHEPGMIGERWEGDTVSATHHYLAHGKRAA